MDNSPVNSIGSINEGIRELLGAQLASSVPHKTPLTKKKNRAEINEGIVKTDNLKLSHNRNVTTKAHTDSCVKGLPLPAQKQDRTEEFKDFVMFSWEAHEMRFPTFSLVRMM